MVNPLINIDISELIRIVKSYGAYFGSAVGFPIAFRDRELEFRRLVNRLVGVRIVYGPLGCGKSTLLMNLARALGEVRSDVIVVYVNFEEKGFMNAVRAYIPGLAGGVKELIIRAVERDLGPVLDRVGLSAIVGVGKLFMDIIKGVSDDAAIRDRYVVLIFDELDKWYRSMLNAPDNAQVGYGPIEGEVMSYAEHFENFLTTDKVQGLSVVFGFSDQGAVNVVRKYGGKGLLEGLLLWYIPKADFMDVLNEVIVKARPSGLINAELLWQLTGGNLRELARIVFNNDWSIERWLRDVIIKLGGVNGILSLLEEVSKYGFNVAELGPWVWQCSPRGI
ncbi:ATP-binding protein [Vulcanisaeta sp. JCM 16161]|uniref:ATP-binding protein n=1 Tax=Vulcanisaeta sp. JCM 16161 TaxID=1295372 RepID=UPI0006D1B6CB|nr:ATP-binding protein [Vulcanisaeta sp. JCM 16161]